MPLSMFALDDKQLAGWKRKIAAKQRWDRDQQAAARQPARSTADDDWSMVLPSRAEPDPSEYLHRRAAEHLDIEWAHFGLSYLLQRAAGLPYSLADLTPEVFGRGLGQGDVFKLELAGAEVDDGSRFLLRLRESELRAAWNAAEMRDLGIFPVTAWDEPDTLETLIATYHALVGLFERAQQSRRTIVVEITM
jgi:hypothetical protein